jgi:hypothetical protein
MNSPLGPKSQRPLLSTIRKRWRLEGWPSVKWMLWRQHHNIRFMVFAAAVGFGLRRSKPRRRWAIGGHRSMAKGVGERVEAAEGLYLSCGRRYSRRKRVGMIVMVESEKNKVMCDRVRGWRSLLLPPWLSLRSSNDLIRIQTFYSEN